MKNCFITSNQILSLIQIRFCICMLLFTFCKTAVVNAIDFHIYGKVTNPTERIIVIKNNYFETTDSIYLDEKNKFNVILNLESNYNFINYGSGQFKVYLEDECDIEINFDATNYPNSLSFSGIGASENRYMLSKNNFINQRLDIMYYGYYALLEEEKFVKYNIDLHKAFLNHLKSAENLSKKFISIEEQSLLIDTQCKFANYESRRKMMLNDNSFTVSQNYVDPFAKISYNNSSLLCTYNYQEYVSLYLQNKVYNVNNTSNSFDFFIQYLNELNKPEYDQNIKDRLSFRDATIGLVHSKDPEKYYHLLLEIIKNEKYKEIIIEAYNELRTKRGQPSEDFKFINSEGKYNSLKDFRGKYLYIDIWATWCRPCIKEIPNIEKLKEEFGSTISIISIAFRDDKERWKEMIESKNMKGIQLFASDNNADFFHFYDVWNGGLPRFILLDKEGKIIESNAKRPSDPFLKKLLSELSDN